MAPPFAQKQPSRFAQMSKNISQIRNPASSISRDLDIARGKKEFFGNNPGVSDDRAFRRIQQADQLQSFKNQFTKPVQGSSNLLQMTADAPRSLSQETMRLANKFGPTPGEIMGDIGRGIGSIFSGIAERGTPLMQLAKSVGSGIMNLLTPKQDVSTMGQAPQFSIGTQFLPADFASQVQSRTMGQAPFPGMIVDASGGQTLTNLTAFGEALRDRVKSERPGITDEELLNVLQRSHRAGFAGSGRPVFFLANGGIATLQ